MVEDQSGGCNRPVSWCNRHKRFAGFAATSSDMTDPTANRDQYAPAALKEQRTLHAGQPAQLENQARTKREALAHIDAVLRMFAPEVDPESIPARRARKGTAYPVDNLSRRIMGVLRCRGEPMPYAEVIDVTAAEIGFPDDAAGVHRGSGALRPP